MLATLITSAPAPTSTQTECGRSGAHDPPATIALLVPVLVAAQQLLAEVIVDGGVGAAPGRAGQRDRRGAGAAAADEQLGLAPMKSASGVPTAEAEAGGELLAQRAEEGGGIVRGGGVDGDLAG